MTAESITHSEQLIIKLIQQGNIKSAIDLYNISKVGSQCLMHFLYKPFDNLERESVAPFLIDKVDLLNADNLPIIIKNIITLAEMSGRTDIIEKGLKKIRKYVSSEEFIEKSKSNEKIATNTCEALIGLFMFEDLERFMSKLKDYDLTKFKDRIKKLRFILSEVNLNTTQVDSAINHLINSTSINVKHDTVVIRIPTNLWQSLDKFEIGTSEIPMPFNIIKSIHLKGWRVNLAPQFSLPGPSLVTPFKSDTSKIIFIDCHKYSNNSIFIHYKSTHNGQCLIDKCGYSGWAEIAHLGKRVNYTNITDQEALSFFLSEKTKAFANIKHETSYKNYVLVPLQVPGDSVQKLAYFNYFEMLEIIINKFTEFGMNIVISRHPQCKDRQVSAYLEKVKSKDNIFLANTKTISLIENAKVIALCNSSIAWDCILAEKPILAFGRAEYSAIVKNVKEITDLDLIENFDDLVNKEEYYKFYYAFWKRYTSKGTANINKRVIRLLDSIHLISNEIENE